MTDNNLSKFETKFDRKLESVVDTAIKNQGNLENNPTFNKKMDEFNRVITGLEDEINRINDEQVQLSVEQFQPSLQTSDNNEDILEMKKKMFNL